MADLLRLASIISSTFAPRHDVEVLEPSRGVAGLLIRILRRANNHAAIAANGSSGTLNQVGYLALVVLVDSGEGLDSTVDLLSALATVHSFLQIGRLARASSGVRAIQGIVTTNLVLLALAHEVMDLFVIL